jgi:uncharacterized membrane protein (UPF0127 family)
MTQSGSKVARPEIRIENLSQEQTLVTHGRVADGFWTRMKGLIGSKPLAEGEALLIVPCNSIHSQFMGFPIDAVFGNKELKVVAIHREMPPWRFGKIHRGAHFVIELPAGTVAATGTQQGDQLQIQGYEF